MRHTLVLHAAPVHAVAMISDEIVMADGTFQAISRPVYTVDARGQGGWRGQALREPDGLLHVEGLCEPALESQRQHGVRAVQLRVGEEQALLTHGPRDRWTHNIVFVVCVVRSQEISPLRVPGSKRAQEHALGATTQLGPDLLDSVNGAA